MANKVIHKRSTVKGQLPTGSTLEHGEIAVNFNSQDPFLSIKDSDGTYRKIIDETAINDKLSKKSDSTHTHSQYVNQNAFSNVKVSGTTIAAASATDTLELVAGDNITITPDATNDKITITGPDLSGYQTKGDYKTIQTEVSSPTEPSGNASAFIDTISQDTNGKITVTKKNIYSGSDAVHGVVLLQTGDLNGVDYADGYAASRAHTHGQYKTKQTAITGATSVTGTSLAFVDNISQNENGVIRATSKTIPTASNTTKGLVKTLIQYQTAGEFVTNPASRAVAPTVAEVSTVLDRYYAVECDVNGVLFVNVPWTGGGTDTKVTSSQSNVKAFLVGSAASGTTTGQLYKNTGVYMQAGKLYANGSEVGTMATINNTVSALTASNVNLDSRITALENNGGGISIAVGTDKTYLMGASSTTATTVNIQTGSTASENGVWMSNGTITATKGFYQVSDEREKNFKNELDIDFDKLKTIPKSYFTWKGDENEKLEIGTSAQKLKEVYPELVSYDSVDDRYTVSYDKLSVVALKAVDKLHEENQMLKEMLFKMEERLSKLENNK